MKWEYEIYKAEKWDAVITNLKLYGEKGWELVSAFESRIQPPEDREQQLVFILKRPAIGDQ